MTKKRRRRRRIKRIILLILFLCLLTGLIILSPRIATVVRLSREAKKLVSESNADTFKISGTTIIYDASGNELCKMQNSKELYYVEYKDIPETLAYSFIVMEDKDYFSHKGIDYKAIVRAIFANQKNDEIVQGASTITQQVAKNIFLTQDVTWERKIKEIFVAREMEKKYSKEQILEFYLNNIYFGNGYYGVEAAARGYFNKSVDDLSLSEQAFIAAIPNNPTKYNPLVSFERTLDRRDTILSRLYKEDYINSMNFHTAVDSDVVLSRQPEVSKNNSVETYARHCATEEIMRIYGFRFRYDFANDYDYEKYIDSYEESYTVAQQRLFSGGYKIFTSIDMKLQEQLQTALDKNLEGYTSMTNGIYDMQAAATCIDNSTGNVVAIVGSRNQNLEGYTLNRAYQSYRQPGSCIKPLVVYLPFLQKGNTPDTLLMDEYTEEGPQNADGAYAGELTALEAVKYSKNTPAWNIYKSITPRLGVSYLINQEFKKVWMDKELMPTCLGGFTYGVSTEEMAGAYASIANEGEFRYPTCITMIVDRKGSNVLDTSNRGEVVYDVESCRKMTYMMESVVEEGGTGYGAAPDNAIISAKTGTTNSNKDAWLCGFSKYYTVAIWQGYDTPKTIDEVYTREIFRDFMKDAHLGLKLVEFNKYKGQNSKDKDKKEEETTEEATTIEGETETQTGVVTDPDSIAETTTSQNSDETTAISDPDKIVETKEDETVNLLDQETKNPNN